MLLTGKAYSSESKGTITLHREFQRLHFISFQKLDFLDLANSSDRQCKDGKDRSEVVIDEEYLKVILL